MVFESSLFKIEETG